MANYFYTDANGQKQGPFSETEIQNLIVKGIIVSTTPIQTDTGLKVTWTDDEHEKTSPWRFNFESHLWVCKLCCIIVWIAAIALGLVATSWGFQTFNNQYAPDAAKSLAIIGVLTTWGYCAFCVAATHLLCTWSLITSKAAQLYVENCEKK